MGNIISTDIKIYPEIYRNKIINTNNECLNEEITGLQTTEVYEIEIDIKEDEPTDRELIQIKKNIIDKLPEDVVIQIYKDYLEPEVYYGIYKKIINDSISKELNDKLLTPLIPIILSKPIVCKYLSMQCDIFRYYFIEHKIFNKKKFTLLKKGKSFALCILFRMYH
jgi:hypothetical protein